MVFDALYYLSKKRFYGLIGLGLIMASFFYWRLPFTNFNLLIFNSLFLVGNILFFDFLSYELTGSSLFHSKKRGIKLSSRILFVGIVFGLILEIYAHWLGKLFYFPYWGLGFYLFVLIPGYAFYSLYLIETYLGVKAVIEHFFHKIRRGKERVAGFKKLFMALGLLGALGIGASTALIFLKTTFGVNAKEFISIINNPFINAAFSGWNSVIFWSATAISFWFFLEYLEYERHETSMLYETIKGNFAPVAAVFISAWISAILYEVLNLPGGLWRYQNIPFSEITLFGVPLFVYLFLWPSHYLALFSLYRLIFKRESEEIWK
ncbi:MAG: hypothetical protein HYW37_02590 [Candidatus Colwellbacteria bacterium]|nr:hypothetical protein [Candidatus Colwellbacteria bacterium]